MPTKKATKAKRNFKSSLCHRFSAGTCEAGARCRYAHGPDDQRHPPASEAPALLPGTGGPERARGAEESPAEAPAEALVPAPPAKWARLSEPVARQQAHAEALPHTPDSDGDDLGREIGASKGSAVQRAAPAATGCTPSPIRLPMAASVKARVVIPEQPPLLPAMVTSAQPPPPTRPKTSQPSLKGSARPKRVHTRVGATEDGRLRVSGVPGEQEYRRAIVNLYEKYNPSKLVNLEVILSKYKGEEWALYAALRAKYEPQRRCAL